MQSSGGGGMNVDTCTGESHVQLYMYRDCVGPTIQQVGLVIRPKN